MKKLAPLITLMILTQFGFGQTVPSSCTAPDSIVKKYNTDADRLTLRKIYQNNLNYVDSIDIPQIHADTILNALIAVYNATFLPARDTVVAIYEIHSFPEPDINRIAITADSNLTWMQQIRNGVSPTGNSTIDSLTNLYHLNLTAYSTISFGPYPTHRVIFISDSNYNFQALTSTYTAINDIYSSFTNGWAGGGYEITSTIYSDHVELIYSIGWGDCPSGCSYRRYWKFKVYYDCSVEFVSSYGNSLTTAIGEFNNSLPITISPNPFNSYIKISGIKGNYDYVIYNILGKELVRKKVLENQIDNLDWLPSGYYFLKIDANGKSITKKLMKK